MPDKNQQRAYIILHLIDRIDEYNKHVFIALDLAARHSNKKLESEIYMLKAIKVDMEIMFNDLIKSVFD